MFNNTKKLITITAITTCTLSLPSIAYEVGDIRIKAGIASVQPDESSTPIALDGTNLSELGLDLPEITVEVADNSQLGLTLTYMLSSNWGVELLASTPFSHDISAPALGVEVGEAKQLPPTLILQYYPMSSDSAFQPYIGLGLNYTVFFSESVDAELNTALTGLGATGNSNLSLDDSFGLAYQVGVDYALNDNWFLNANIWKIDIDTTAEITTPGLGLLTTDVEIDPIVYMLSLGYKL